MLDNIDLYVCIARYENVNIIIEYEQEGNSKHLFDNQNELIGLFSWIILNWQSELLKHGKSPE